MFNRVKFSAPVKSHLVFCTFTIRRLNGFNIQYRRKNFVNVIFVHSRVPLTAELQSEVTQSEAESDFLTEGNAAEVF